MARGDVETIAKYGQWIDHVEGEEESSRSFSTKEEAIEEGARMAALRHSAHRVVDSPPTGAATDEQDAGTGDTVRIEDLP